MLLCGSEIRKDVGTEECHIFLPAPAGVFVCGFLLLSYAVFSYVLCNIVIYHIMPPSCPPFFARVRPRTEYPCPYMALACGACEYSPPSDLQDTCQFRKQ